MFAHCNFVVSRRTTMRLILLLSFFISTFISFRLLSRRKSSIDPDALHLTVVDHRTDHDSFGVLVPAKSNRARSQNIGKYAYVSLLCQDGDLPQARVVVFSVMRSKTNIPIVVMLMPEVSPGAAQELEQLGAIVKRIEQPLDWKFMRRDTQKLPSFDKRCRMSKLNLWKLTEYEKVVYLDSTLLVINNIDELFQYGEFSAVKVVGDEFNTGLFVARPDIKTFEEMMRVRDQVPAWYQGEQGFLNWFFQHRPNSRYHHNVISTRYNTVMRLKDYAVWPMLKRSAKVFHFHRQTAPWNFYHTAHPEWDQNFEPTIFSYWHQIHQQALQFLNTEDFTLANSTWPNLRRTLELCSSVSSMYNPAKFSITNKFSVIIGTWDRVVLLRKLILHYQKSRMVHKIYVTWHNPNEKPPEDFIRLLRRKPPVEILPQKYDSLNNRFNPIPNLQTKAVLIADDDVRVNLTDIEYAFEVWRMRSHSLVGTFPRYHVYNANNNTYSYLIRSPEVPRAYSIILTKFMFMSADYLFDYTCLLPLSIHRYIDEHSNCEDVAMNLLVSGMTSARPIAVMMHVDDFGTTSGISNKMGHLPSRSQCLTDLISLFGKDTLLYNREVFLPFRRRKLTLNA